MTESLVNAEVVAEHLGLPVSWVRENTRSGAIPHLQLGRFKRYHLADVDAWLERSAIRPGSSRRTSFVYIFEASHGVKVGITSRSPEGRCSGIQTESGVPISVYRSWETESRGRAWRVEQETHRLLAENRTIGEWFDCHPLKAVDAVERAFSICAERDIEEATG